MQCPICGENMKVRTVRYNDCDKCWYLFKDEMWEVRPLERARLRGYRVSIPMVIALSVAILAAVLLVID